MTTSLVLTGLVVPSVLFALLYFPALERSLTWVSPYPTPALRKRVSSAAIDGLVVIWFLAAYWNVNSLPWAVAAIAYGLCRDSLGGQSIGKLLVGLVVIHVDTGQRCGLFGSITRNAFFILPGANLVAVVLEARTLVRDPQGQRLGDRLAHTQVIEGLGARDVVMNIQRWWAGFLADLPRAARGPGRARPSS